MADTAEVNSNIYNQIYDLQAVRRQDFLRACHLAAQRSPGAGGIGTLSEKTLHAALKNYFEPYADNQETAIGRYVADIVGPQGIIEIQTRSLSRLHDKLQVFLEAAWVTVVYPIAQVKWVCWLDPDTGELLSRRRSPKKGRPEHAFYELYRLADLLGHPNLQVCLVFLELEEYRQQNGYGRGKKRRATRYECRPLDILDQRLFTGIDDWAALLPKSMPQPFTTADYSSFAHLHLHTAQRALALLYKVGALQRVGKQGRYYLYARPDPGRRPAIHE